MQWISCHNGELQTLLEGQRPRAEKAFVTGLKALDRLTPPGGLARGAVHEVIGGPDGSIPLFFAFLLARSAIGEGKPPDEEDLRLDRAIESTGAIAWCDPKRELYPPALAAAGLPLQRLILLHPQASPDEIWTLAECLRCKGIGATIAAPGRLNRLQARRLQLAAEQGAGVGLLIHPWAQRTAPYAAATRWLVQPFPGTRTVQRWTIQLIHGHGGRVGDTVILEHCRETHCLRASEQLADRPAETKTIRATA